MKLKLELEEIKKEMEDNPDVEIHGACALKELLSGLKVIERSKHKGIKAPYLEAKLIIPREVATNIKDFFSGWSMGFFFL